MEIVSPSGLLKLATKPSVRIVDTRRFLDYKAAHVPGAVNIPFTSFMKLKGLAFDIPSKEEIEDVLSRAGVENETLVVAYDDYSGRHACRFLYTLEVYGHNRLGILNKPFTAYLEEGWDIERHVMEPEPSSYRAHLLEDKVITKDRIMKALESKDALIIDARPPADFQLSRIPTAINLPWYLCSGGETVFKPRGDLTRIFGDLGVPKDRPVIVYCDEGTGSALVLYALRIAGYDEAFNYHMSYLEWGMDPFLPKEGVLTQATKA